MAFTEHCYIFRNSGPLHWRHLVAFVFAFIPNISNLSGSLEALPHFSTWGGGLPVLYSIRTYCFWEETHRMLHPSTCFIRSFRVAFNSLILFLFTSLCLSVKTLFLICHFKSAISLFIFKISRSTSFWEGMMYMLTA